MLQSNESIRHSKMVVVESQDYDDEDCEVVSIYLVVPQLEANTASRDPLEIEAICACDEKDNALAIAEAWNAYHIKN